MSRFAVQFAPPEGEKLGRVMIADRVDDDPNDSFKVLVRLGDKEESVAREQIVGSVAFVDEESLVKVYADAEKPTRTIIDVA